MEDNNVTDYKAVSPEEFLYRRTYATPEKNYLNPDGSATSRAFKLREKDKGQLSVDIKSLTTPESSVGDSKRFMLFELAAGAVYKAGLSAYHDPSTLEVHGFENPAHGFIWGLTYYPDPADEDDRLPGLLARASHQVKIQLT